MPVRCMYAHLHNIQLDIKQNIPCTKLYKYTTRVSGMYEIFMESTGTVVKENMPVNYWMNRNNTNCR